MQIRAATNDDAEAIRQVVFGILREYDLMAEHEGVDADLNDIEANYAARGGMFEIVEIDEGGIVGTVGVHARDDGVCELRKMYLLPEYRGRGWGRKLLERALAFARTNGFRRMELETSSKLVEAIALYKRNGFTPLARDSMACRCDQAFGLDL